MLKPSIVIVSVVAGLSTVAGCSGESAYCAAVKDHQATLEEFGKKRTNDRFADYAKAARAVGEAAPETVAADWATIAAVTDGVLQAHEAVGFTLEDMADPDEFSRLTTAQAATIQEAYDAFNTSRTQRMAVTRSIQKQCDIVLK